MFERLLDRAFGEKARHEIQQFLENFEQVLLYLSRNQGEMRDFFGGADVAFLLVSSPKPEALEEAFFFEAKARGLSLPLAGYVLNRSLAWRSGLPLPSEALLPPDASAAARRARRRLRRLAGAYCGPMPYRAGPMPGIAARPDAFSLLDRSNARSNGIDEKWAASNEQWWDWYLSLAHDDGRDPGPELAAKPLPALPPPSLPELAAELDSAYRLPPEAVEFFRREGFVKLKQVCSPASLLLLRRALDALFARALGDAPAMRFPSLEMMWTIDPIARAFVLSRRLARIAAELLGVESVRLYHDNALSKLPGCGRTPWHYDAHHYPIASENVVTVWVPLQPTPSAMGPLAFARGIESWRRVADLPFSKFDDSYDRGIAAALRDGGVTVEDGPFELGEVSFHHTRSLHTAGPNRSSLARVALATTYLEAGARLVGSPTLISGDFEKFMPGVGPGEPITSHLNPVVYPRSAAS